MCICVYEYMYVNICIYVYMYVYTTHVVRPSVDKIGRHSYPARNLMHRALLSPHHAHARYQHTHRLGFKSAMAIDSSSIQTKGHPGCCLDAGARTFCVRACVLVGVVVYS